MTSPIAPLHAAVDTSRAREAAIRAAERVVCEAASDVVWKPSQLSRAVLKAAVANWEAMKTRSALERGGTDEGNET